jgi:hypothetical protein
MTAKSFQRRSPGQQKACRSWVRRRHSGTSRWGPSGSGRKSILREPGRGGWPALVPLLYAERPALSCRGAAGAVGSQRFFVRRGAVRPLSLWSHVPPGASSIVHHAADLRYGILVRLGSIFSIPGRPGEQHPPTVSIGGRFRASSCRPSADLPRTTLRGSRIRSWRFLLWF